MKNICICSAFLIPALLFVFPVFAQKFAPKAGLQGQAYTDSLLQALSKTRIDTDKVNLLNAISENISYKDSSIKIKYAMEALHIAEGIKKKVYLMNCYVNLGRIYAYQLKKYTEATNYFQLLENTAKQAGDTASQITALSNLLVTYEQRALYAKGLYCGNQALNLHPEDERKVGLLNNMGTIYLNVADYPKAMKCYTMALNYEERIIAAKNGRANRNDTMTAAIMLLSIGDVYNKMKEYDRAIDNYKQAILVSHNYTPISIEAYMNMGAVLENRNNYAGAIEMYNTARGLLKQRRHNENQTSTLSHLAGLYLMIGDINTAKSMADSALSFSIKYKEEALLPDVYMTLAKINNRGNQYDRAVKYLLDAIKVARESGTLEKEDAALETLSSTYKSMNRPAEAFGAFKRYIAIRDSIFNIDNAKEITRMDVESQYNTIRIGDSVKNAQQKEIYRVNMQKQKTINISAFTVAALLILLSAFIYRNYIQQKKANLVISNANIIIKKEKKISEDLLLNILPAEIAEELKEKGEAGAKMLDEVTVLFTDFKGFTSISEKMSAEQLVRDLNECFSAFDHIMEKHNMEKIKTIGDSYMAAGGLPTPNNTHAVDAIKASLEIVKFIEEGKAKKIAANAPYFEIRIGIHTGPVVAGIVGVKKFQYDIWGDTVNTASRMESSGEAGKVNISGSTYELVKDKFAFTHRGKIQAKGKGEVDMYFVEWEFNTES